MEGLPPEKGIAFLIEPQLTTDGLKHVPGTMAIKLKNKLAEAKASEASA